MSQGAADEISARCSRALLERRVPGGGFGGRPGGQYRPDASAWATLALADTGSDPEALRGARARLAADQLEDGRVPVRPEHASAAWPTPLAILAWYGSTPQRDARLRAVGFLLGTTGVHWPPRPDAVTGHDASIRGWPWNLETHSWVEPTSLCILALEAVGQGDHERVHEASRMLLDRMLPGGGWNYGNTTVFGQELRPLPESTGVALNALAGRVEAARIAPSLAYLEAELPRIRTPFTLGWGLLGLGAWGTRPEPATSWIDEVLAREALVGPYDTSHLALLLLGHRAPSGLLSALRDGTAHA